MFGFSSSDLALRLCMSYTMVEKPQRKNTWWCQTVHIHNKCMWCNWMHAISEWARGPRLGSVLFVRPAERSQSRNWLQITTLWPRCNLVFVFSNDDEARRLTMKRNCVRTHKVKYGEENIYICPVILGGTLKKPKLRWGHAIRAERTTKEGESGIEIWRNFSLRKKAQTFLLQDWLRDKKMINVSDGCLTL